MVSGSTSRSRDNDVIWRTDSHVILQGLLSFSTRYFLVTRAGNNREEQQIFEVEWVSIPNPLIST